VTTQNDNKETANLERLNEELTNSLSRCRELVSECRERLAANSNDPDDLEDCETRLG
jgi:hypothetical protein